MKRVSFMTWDVGDISKGLEACLGHMLLTHVNDSECWTAALWKNLGLLNNNAFKVNWQPVRASMHWSKTALAIIVPVNLKKTCQSQ